MTPNIKQSGDRSSTDRGNETIPLEQLMEELHSSPEGLTTTEATNRLARYGYNELAEKKVNSFLIFLAYF